MHSAGQRQAEGADVRINPTRIKAYGPIPTPLLFGTQLRTLGTVCKGCGSQIWPPKQARNGGLGADSGLRRPRAAAEVETFRRRGEGQERWLRD